MTPESILIHMQSSGSGSDCGSGSRTRKASHQRAIANGDDNSNGNTDNENTSSEINLRGGSDNGSGTQVSICCLVALHLFSCLCTESSRKGSAYGKFCSFRVHGRNELSKSKALKTLRSSQVSHQHLG